MDSFKGRCPHRSVPVEMDESMTSVSLEQALPTCQQCTKHTSIQGMQDRGCEPKERADLFVDLWRLPEGHLHRQPRGAPEPHFPNTHSGQMGPSHSALVWPPDHRQPVLYYSTDSVVNHSRGYTGPPNWPEERSVEETESLECPLPLKSDVNSHQHIPSRYPAAHTPGQCGGPVQGGGLRKCVCHIPADPPQNNYSYYQHNQDYPRNPRQTPQANQQLWNSPHNNRPFREAPNANRASVPQCVAPPREVMQEVSIESSFRADPGPVTRETRRTISLPEECRNVFITYSVDTARDMIPFTKFLTDQGFRPAIDIFDNPVRRMDTTKWMDRYLLDKSILIIVVISPKYKEDVEGDADDEHGLHTKYIHNQIKNDFILQGCLNFRLVPVLFPYATKTHVPKWLQSTRIYSWPRDTQDLLLRLLREERYIVPQPRGSLTLTVRPV